MRERVEMLGGDRRKRHQADTLVRTAHIFDKMRSVVDGNLVSSGGQTNRQLFVEGFEAAVAGGNAAGTYKSYFHARVGR